MTEVIRINKSADREVCLFDMSVPEVLKEWHFFPARLLLTQIGCFKESVFQNCIHTGLRAML